MLIAAIGLSIAILIPSQARGDDPVQESQWVPLFDGTTLNGWSGDSRFWSVQGGAITGTTTTEQPLDANSFLIWRDALDDFELKLKFRIEGGNSGIQYRSQDLGDFHVGGYQADIDAEYQYIGILYDERGRGILANRCSRVEIDEQGEIKVVGKTCDEAALLSSIKQSEWSEYTITAHGNHLTQSINGFITVDVVDGQSDQAESRGILALQLHAGPPMKVQFKDILLRRPSDTQPSPSDAIASPAPSPSPAAACSCACPSPPSCCRPRAACRPRCGGIFRR